ncbi:putative mannosyltransferase [Serendipita vermifera]|nr:putative mannosyltransferase [Serendipita vermifera]
MKRYRLPAIIITLYMCIVLLLSFHSDLRERLRYKLQDQWRKFNEASYEKGKYPQIGTMNATFVVLAQNSEIDGVILSIEQIEESFNKRYHYPYVFLNDVPFTKEFKERTTRAISSKASYGVIPSDHWNQPAHIDEELATKGREELAKEGFYAKNVAYRNMCRFNSGFFYRHELVKSYKWYWRIEPNVKFFCQLEEDPFLFMQQNNKVYGFTMSLYEFPKTIPTLWNATREFILSHPEYLPEDNAMKFISDDDGLTFNLCHFWSNFEIADMDFWRSEPYMKYFEFLDEKGGFYYERWGDAPVHSLGVALFAHKDQIHWFNEIGYRHDLLQHCPQGELHTKGSCTCSQASNWDLDEYSCLPRYQGLFEEK